MNPAISDIGNDIIKSRKRGRPASGRVMDGALFRRVPKEHLTTLSELIDEAIVRVTKDKLGLNKTPGEWIESWQRVLDKGGTYPINAGEVIKEIPATGPSQKEFDDLKAENETLKAKVQVKQLTPVNLGYNLLPDKTGEVSRLKKEVETLRNKIKEMERMYA